ncbi:MAG: N-acetylmuramoyl-L-alanine amidase [Candidatus Coatesbacteria bacterium]|nr:N-acetylmuramoyl-L-alanine amidase [Candidatus Coatesbacteria bacterium]
MTILLVAFSVAASGAGAGSSAASEPPFQQAAIELVRADGHQLVDLDALARSLGLEKTWNALGRKVIVSNQDRFLVLFIGSNRVALDGQIVRLSTSPSIVNGAILVPIDFITEALNGIMDGKLSFDVVREHVVVFDRRKGMTQPIKAQPSAYSKSNPLQEDLVQQDESLNGATEATATNGRPNGGLRFRDADFDVVVIDPGHGGADAGDCGPTGLLEKEVTMKLAMRLKKSLERKTKLRVVLTRDADVPVSLERRTALANSEKADLFISLHATGSPNRDSSGLRAFVASVEASDPETAKTVSAENKVIASEPENEAQKPDEYAAMLWDLSENEYFREGLALAKHILGACGSSEAHLASTGPAQGPFIVLIGASMPAVLLEIGYLSNPADEQLLKQGEYLDKLAEAICQGVVRLTAQTAGQAARDD